jgi:hypothetical protein
MQQRRETRKYQVSSAVNSLQRQDFVILNWKSPKKFKKFGTKILQKGQGLERTTTPIQIHGEYVKEMHSFVKHSATSLSSYCLSTEVMYFPWFIKLWIKPYMAGSVYFLDILRNTLQREARCSYCRTQLVTWHDTTWHKFKVGISWHFTYRLHIFLPY